MEPTTHWQRWHEPYDDPTSLLSRRLRMVQWYIGEWLDSRADARLTVLSLCAGQCHDLLGLLEARADRDRVHAVAVELDPGNVALARDAAAGLPQVQVREADAGDPASWADVSPVDLVLLTGMLGNISDDDVQRTVAALPALCRGGATVIWTRTRRLPDLTPAIRAWFTEAGFTELAFDAPADVLFSVGVHRLDGSRQASPPSDRLFRFVN